MTVSEKHREIAKVIYDALGRGSARDEETIARALAAAEREGMRRAAEIASDHCFARDIEWWLNSTKKEVSAEACRSVSAAILSQANIHSVALHPPGATEAGEAVPQTSPVSPATNHSSRNGRGE